MAKAPRAEGFKWAMTSAQQSKRWQRYVYSFFEDTSRFQKNLRTKKQQKNSYHSYTLDKAAEIFAKYNAAQPIQV